MLMDSTPNPGVPPRTISRARRRSLGGMRFRFAPNVEQCLTMLAELETGLGGERDAAHVVGPSIITVRCWKRRKRMSVPARRLVWLVWALVLHPETVQTVGDLVTWGRLDSKARSEGDTLLPASKSPQY